MDRIDMVNVILLTGNLVLWGALFLCLRWKGSAARSGMRAMGMGTAETAASSQSVAGSFAEALAGFLEFAVYGVGMIRVADLIVQGIAAPGSVDRALLAVRILLAESMVILFPLWNALYRWKLEEDGSGTDREWESYAGGGSNPDSEGLCGWKATVLKEGEGILGMLLLLGLTLQGWQEQDLVRAFGRQACLLLLFFCYGYLRRRRRLRDSAMWCCGMGRNLTGCGGSTMGIPVECHGTDAAERGALARGYGGSAREASEYGYGRGTEATSAWRYGRAAAGMPIQSLAGNADRAREMEYLKNVEQQYQRTRELWHDLKNHIKVLEILAQEERFGELTDYLDSFRQDVERQMVPARTGCAPVDALLGDKLYLAGKQGTELSLQLCGLSQTGIEAVDLCVILGNLLDNALEACARLEGRGRIRLRMRREEEFYYIAVINTSEEPHREGESYVSAKRDRDNGVGHGLGLRSAERLAHRYGGLLATDYSDGEFRVVVRLQDGNVTVD